MDGSTKHAQGAPEAELHQRALGLASRGTPPPRGAKGDATLLDSPRRKANRVVQLFPSELFDGHMMRRALFLPKHLFAEDLALGSTPVTKMINVMPLQKLVERRRREQAVNRDMTGTVAARLLEPVAALQKRLRPGAALDLGMTFVDYVQEGQHSKDTTFFFLYHIAEEKPRRTSAQAFESAVWGRTFTGTEEGLWFVLAVVDVLVNTDLGPITLLSTQLSSATAAKYPIAVFSDDTARLTQEYRRFLLGRNAPPRAQTDTSSVDLLHLGSDVSFLLFQHQRAVASRNSNSSSPVAAPQTPSSPEGTAARSPPPRRDTDAPPNGTSYHWPSLKREPGTASATPSLSPPPAGAPRPPQTGAATTATATAAGTREGVRLPSLRDLIESARHTAPAAPLPLPKRHEGEPPDLTALCRAALAQAVPEDEGGATA